MKHSKSLSLVLLIGLLLITGCQQTNGEDNASRESVDALTDDHRILTEKIESLTNRIDDLEEGEEMLLRLIDEQVTILSGELDDDYTILPIYHLDINTYDMRVQYYTMVQQDVELDEKVKNLAEKLSVYSFDGLPIQLLRIETLDNEKRIAVIDLIDPEDRIMSRSGKTWSGIYFQGSSGGHATATKLLDTFLQKDYAGEWIDGVKFLYNGDETNLFEHIGELLGETYYRGM